MERNAAGYRVVVTDQRGYGQAEGRARLGQSLALLLGSAGRGQSEGWLGTPDSLGRFCPHDPVHNVEITALHADWHSEDDSGRAASRTVQS